MVRRGALVESDHRLRSEAEGRLIRVVILSAKLIRRGPDKGWYNVLAAVERDAGGQRVLLAIPLTARSVEGKDATAAGSPAWRLGVARAAVARYDAIVQALGCENQALPLDDPPKRKRKRSRR